MERRVKEAPNKLLLGRKWTAWGDRKALFPAADYWITKAKPWLSALKGAPLPQQAIIAGAPSTDSTAQTARSVAPCSWLVSVGNPEKLNRRPSESEFCRLA